MKTFFAPKEQSATAGLRIEDDFEAARTVGSMISGLGWMLFGIPMIVAVAMLSGDYGPVETRMLAAGAAFLLSALGLAVVALGQITRAIAETANNTRAIRAMLAEAKFEREHP